MRLLICMDELASLDFNVDNTLFIIHQANKKGWYCAYFTLKDLFCENNIIYANLTQINVKKLNDKNAIELKNIGKTQLDSFDILLMRKDPPWNMEYLYATYAFDFLEKAGVLVVNSPQGLRDANEKYFALNFSKYNPEHIVSRDINLLAGFWEEHKNVIFKPLSDMGGRGIVHIEQDGKNLYSILELLTNNNTISIMAQRYIPDIKSTGDKRIIIINGKPLDYALCRMPGKDLVRANFLSGGTSTVVELTPKDYEICAYITDVLLSKGLYFVGVDVIGEYITEVNVTSPAGLTLIYKKSDIDGASIFLEELIVLKKKIT